MDKSKLTKEKMIHGKTCWIKVPVNFYATADLDTQQEMRDLGIDNYEIEAIKSFTYINLNSVDISPFLTDEGEIDVYKCVIGYKDSRIVLNCSIEELFTKMGEVEILEI